MNDQCNIEDFYNYCKGMIHFKNDNKRNNVSHRWNSHIRHVSKPRRPDGCPDISELNVSEIEDLYKVTSVNDYSDYVDFADNYHTLKQPNMSIKTIKTLGPYHTTAQSLEDEKKMLIGNFEKIRLNSPPSKIKQASIIARHEKIKKELNENETNKSESVLYRRGGKHFKRKTFKRKNSKRRKSAKRNSSKNRK
jgi:hypothetical protein